MRREAGGVRRNISGAHSAQTFDTNPETVRTMFSISICGPDHGPNSRVEHGLARLSPDLSRLTLHASRLTKP